MVTTTEWMLNWIHSNTTNLWPAVSLDLVFVVGTTGLQEWFINTSTTSNDTNGGTASGVKDLLWTGWQLDSGLASILVVWDDDGGVTGSLGELTTVTDLHFNWATGGTWDFMIRLVSEMIQKKRTFWHISDWEHIANVEGSLVTAVDRLSSGCTFSSDEGLGVLAKLDFTETSRSIICWPYMTGRFLPDLCRELLSLDHWIRIEFRDNESFSSTVQGRSIVLFEQSCS